MTIIYSYTQYVHISFLQDCELLKQLDLAQSRSESATHTAPQEVPHDHRSFRSNRQTANMAILSQENTDFELGVCKFSGNFTHWSSLKLHYRIILALSIIPVNDDPHDYGVMSTEYLLDQPRQLEEDSDADHELGILSNMSKSCNCALMIVLYSTPCSHI